MILDIRYRVSICKIIQLAVEEEKEVRKALVDTGMIVTLVKMISTDHREVNCSL